MGLWGWGWRAPLSMCPLVFTKGRKTGGGGCLRYPTGRPGPSGWKARAGPDGLAHYPHMARGDVESDGFWELCLAQE